MRMAPFLARARKCSSAALGEAKPKALHISSRVGGAPSASRLLRMNSRISRWRGLIEKDEAQAMRAWEHGGGFSLDAGVRIEGNDRQGLERLLRYCARPAFALERLRQIDAEHLVYESTKPGPGGSVSLILTPMELLDRLAALVEQLAIRLGYQKTIAKSLVMIPPPRRHRHRYS